MATKKSAPDNRVATTVAPGPDIMAELASAKAAGVDTTAKQAGVSAPVGPGTPVKVEGISGDTMPSVEAHGLAGELAELRAELGALKASQGAPTEDNRIVMRELGPEESFVDGTGKDAGKRYVQRIDPNSGARCRTRVS